MVINKLDATFGKLDGQALTLTPGLNVISAPNESGKSTWCAFIRAMLYGIDSSERQKAGYLPDKTRYAPWSGAAMCGSMELSLGDRQITLVRTSKTPSAPMREFSAVYTGTSVPVEGLTALNAGQMLTGVERDVFRRSAFIEQGKVAVTHSAELEKRISAIVTSGDEDYSYTEADERLRQWQRKRRFNRRGRLPELEDELSHKKMLMSELGGIADRRDSLTRELSEAKAECESLEAEMTESRKTVRREALSNLASARSEVNAASERHDAAVRKREQCRSALQQSVIGERQPDEVRAEGSADIEKAKSLRAEASQKGSPAGAIIFIILAIAAAVLGVVLPAYGVYAFCAAGVCAIAAVILLIRLSKKRGAAHDAERQLRQLLSKYKAESENGISACVEEYERLYAQLKAAQESEKLAFAKLSEARARQEQAESRTLSELDFTSGDNRAAQLTRRLSDARARCSRLSQQIAELNGRIAAMGDPMVLGSEIRDMESEYTVISAEYDAIALAVETLRAADEDIQSRFAPALGKLAAEYMQEMTGGKYDTVMLNRDFSAAVRENGDSVPRKAEYLSAGTLDLMYLAVRLAVCTLALPEGANCPLIIDDALVNLDEQRAQQAMTLLEKLSHDRQVILFTCK